MAGERDSAKRGAGEPFKPPAHNIWNNMVDAGQAHAASKISTQNPPPTEPRATDIVKVKNISCGPRRRGEVLAICSKLITDLDAEHIWLNAAGPSDNQECFGVLLKDTPADKIEQLQMSGRALALVNRTTTTEVGKRCKVVTGSVVLQEDEEGDIDIVWGPASTGEQECVVLLTDPCPTTTTTTTTTADPAAPATTPSPYPLQCDGYCGWTMTSGTWVETFENCSPTTTTTSDPCPCPDSSGTTPAPCNCIPPDQCAPEASTVVTYCSQYTHPDPPFCSTTTTTTSTTTTSTTTTSTTTVPTTTCDCSLTTTTTIDPGAPDCSKGCDWVGVPTIGWTQTANGCLAGCPCFPPAGIPPSGSCPTAHTPCYTTSPPVTTAPPACGGECVWQCVNGTLYFDYSDCDTYINCNCIAPPSCSGCGEVRNPCGGPTTVAPTTTTCDPADCYCVCRPPPTTTTSTTSGPTTTTTSTSTTTTTTTTADPCYRKYCFWTRSACPDPWNIITPCSDSSCGCSQPPLTQVGYCDKSTWSRCVGTTSTTTGGPTTTTTTTTGAPTTTCDPGTNDCRVQCAWTGYGYAWVHPPASTPSGVADFCCGAGTCTIPYCGPCNASQHGQTCNGYCTDATTTAAPTTTGAPPTTTFPPTTTQTTTTGDPACLLSNCIWEWHDPPGAWISFSACPDGCSCQNPDGPASTHGDQQSFPCY